MPLVRLAPGREPVLEVSGIVIAHVRDAFRVALDDSGHVVHARIGAKLVKNHIRISVADRVKLHVWPRDLSRGRIVYRLSS